MVQRAQKLELRKSYLQYVDKAIVLPQVLLMIIFIYITGVDGIPRQLTRLDFQRSCLDFMYDCDYRVGNANFQVCSMV